MKCRISKKLNRYLDGELGENESRKIKSHLNECRQCRQEHNRLLEINNLIESVEDLECPEILYENVMTQINRRKIIKLYPGKRLRSKILPIAASFLISFLIGTLLSISTFKEKSYETDDLSFGSESFAYYFEGEE